MYIYLCKFVVYLQHVINLFCDPTTDGSDDLFSQSTKKVRKPSTKKDAIEDLFDNDSDDFLDQVGKDKNDPADDAPVDMVSVCTQCLSSARSVWVVHAVFE